MDFADFARSLARRKSVRRRVRVVVRQTRSTHLLARRLVGEYGRDGLAPPPTNLLAWRQTGGLGRDGRGWSSPAGHGVYATLIRPLRAGDEAIQSLPLLISVALCETLNRYLAGAGRCRLKWPNDLVVGGSGPRQHKLGGILIDVMSQGDRVGIISMGVNVSSDLAAFGEPRATSLEAEMARAEQAGRAPGAPPPLDEVAGELIAAVDAALARETRPAELIGRYRSLSLHRPGERLRCRLASETLVGTFRGFDRLGFLRLEVNGGERLLSAGIISDGE